MRASVLLLGAHARALRNVYLSTAAGRRRLMVISLLALLFAAAVFGCAHWMFSRCLEIEPIGEIIIRRALAMVLLAVYSLLAFSSLVGAFSTLYLANDLQLLVSSPVGTYTLYAARFVQTSVLAAWMVIPFSAPIFIAAGLLLHADASYYGVLCVVFLSMAMIPPELGIVVSLLVTSVLSARRARNVLLALGALAAGVLVFVLRRLEPEKLMNPDAGAPLIDALRTMHGLDPPWLPSSWAVDALWPHLGWSADPGWSSILLLLATSAMAFFVGGWVFRALHPRAFSRAQEGLHRPVGRRLHPRRPTAMRAVAPGVLSYDAELRRKDRRVFVRDPAQWSQMLTLAAIVAIYVLNFRYIRVIAGTGMLSDLGLHFLNLALCGFVGVALAARFVYPAVSLEGPAFWLILCAPRPMAAFLRAKAAAWFAPLAAFSALLMVTTHVFLRTDPWLSLLSVLTVAPLAYGVVALGIGLGARYPKFDADNPVEVATGIGGLFFMLAGTAVLGATTVLSIWPSVVFVRWIHHPGPMSLQRALIAVVCAFLVVAVPVGVGRKALSIGAHHLERGP